MNNSNYQPVNFPINKHFTRKPCYKSMQQYVFKNIKQNSGYYPFIKNNNYKIKPFNYFISKLN